MRYRKILILCFIIIGCKNSTKEGNENLESNTITSTEMIDQVVENVSIAPIDQWDFRGIAMSKTDMFFGIEEVYKLQVADDVKTSTFVAINNVKINYTGGRYRISVIVKSLEENNNIGIRIQEVYPNRYDVVFDLNTIKVKGTFKQGDFIEEESVFIESLGDGWLKCNITAEIYASYFRLVLGPTNVPEKQTKSWEAEALNNKERAILIVPSSLKVEELEN